MNTVSATELDLEWAVPPGRILQRELDALGITQAQLASRTGLSPKHINLVIKGHASLSPDMAVLLEFVLGSTAELWLDLEAGYRAREAREQRRSSLSSFVDWSRNFPKSILVDRGIVGQGDSNEDVVEKLLNFFGVTSPAAYTKTWLEPQVSYKRSQRHVVDTNLTALWLRLAEQEAAPLLRGASEYDAVKLRLVASKLPKLSTKAMKDGFRTAQVKLLSAGVVLVFVPEIQNTRISGVSRWIGKKPIIAVTSRYKAFDSFWFTLLHEVAHLLLHPKRGTYVDYAGTANDDNDENETAANNFAQTTLVPPHYRPAVLCANSQQEIEAVATSLGVSPGIVAGQHAFLTGNWGGPIAKLRHRGNLEDILID